MSLTSFWPLPAGAELRSIPVGDVELAVLYVPVAQPRGVVHFVHGYTGSKEDAWAIAPEFAARGFSFIAHDQRGQFQSGHGDPSTYELGQLAKDIHSIHDALGISKVHLIGHSFGGLVAQEFALSFSQSLASLTLLCSGPVALTERIDKFDYTRDFLSGHDAAEVRDYWLRTRDPLLNLGFGEDATDMWTTRWLASDMRSVRNHLKIMSSVPDRTQAIAELSIPTHVVYGEFDDAWPLVTQLEMASTLKASVTVIKNAGHCPNEDQPAALVEAVLSLIGATS
jgi:pimeloyl-ACP methyl ester carboxylesterase